MNYKIYYEGDELNRGVFCFSKYVDKKYILVFHGLLGRGKNWNSIIKRLSSLVNQYFIVLDLRNHGENDPASKISYQLMVGDVYDFVKKKGIKDFSIIGHSMGGKLGMIFSLEFPKLVNQLFVVDIAPVTYPLEENEIIDVLIKIDLDNCKNRNDADRQLSEYVKNKNLRIFLLQNLDLNNGKYSWSLNLNAIKQGMANLRGFPVIDSQKYSNVSTICIYGEKSVYLNENYKNEFRKLFTNLRFKKVDNAGHWLHFENSEEFIEIIYKNLI